MNFPDILSLDIETRGILFEQTQTTFHPVQMEVVDGFTPDNTVVSVALGWRTPTGYDSAVFIYSDHAHRRNLRRWLKLAHDHGAVILGQNLVFDLCVLRHVDPYISYLTRVGGPLRYDDLMLVNFLDFEQRPEKALKPLTTLFGLGSYTTEKVTGSKGNATGPWDSHLHHYNAADAVRTLQLYDLILDRIRQKYGPSSPKLSATCSDHRHALIRVGLEMRESGVCMSRYALERAADTHLERINTLVETADSHHITLQGKGSDTSKRLFINECFLAHNLLSDPRTERTKERHDICINKNNLQILLADLPADSPDRLRVELIYEHTDLAKIRSSYYKPLLTSRTKGLTTPTMCYPSWHLVPSGYGKSSTDSKGTIQGRITATKPGLQTFPPEIKACHRSRYLTGTRLSADFEQLEIACAAFLSQDPTMLDEWDARVDRHAVTGQLIIDTLQLSSPTPADFTKIYRAAGKTLNFLVLYLGGPDKFRSTLLTDAGRARDYELLRLLDREFTPAACKEIIHAFNARYPRFRQWQSELIDSASRDGYLSLPTGWSRTFPPGKAALACVTEICNFPVQCLAAQITQHCQYTLLLSLRSLGLRTRMCSQTYDSIDLDCPASELATVKKILPDHLTSPSLFGIFEQPRRVTLRYEVSELCNYRQS